MALKIHEIFQVHIRDNRCDFPASLWIISSIQFDWTWGTLCIRNLRVNVQKKMLRKSSLLCLRSNNSHSFNIDLGACLADEEESIRSQSVFKHGYQARRNLPKCMWSLVKKVSGKLRKRTFVWSTNDGGHFECSREFSRDVTSAMLMSRNKGSAAMLVSHLILREFNSTLMQNTFFLLFWLKNMLIHHLSKNTLCAPLPSLITWSPIWPYKHFEEGWARILVLRFSILVIILHLKLSWADLISFTRILCYAQSEWSVRSFPSACWSWVSRIFHKLRRWGCTSEVLVGF